MIEPIPVVAIQVNQDNSLFVTTGVDYDKSGTIVGTEITSQYTLVPGDDLTGQPQEVVNLANALWTPAVIEAYKLAHPAPPEPEAIQVELVENPVLQDAAN